MSNWLEIYGSSLVGAVHRRRIETENMAKCRRFGLGVKIECRTWKFWCESVALCT